MPLIKIADNNFPEWSELKKVSMLKPEVNAPIQIKKSFSRFGLFLISGECKIKTDQHNKALNEGDSFFSDQESITIIPTRLNTEIFLTEGEWGSETGSSGVFKMNNSTTPRNIGDPVSYTRTTEFDNHYHDCDEFWIILKGSGLAVIEGVKYKFSAGDIVATRMGDHHDLPEIYDELGGIFFETSLKGKKRGGHLWLHTHGLPDYSIREKKI